MQLFYDLIQVAWGEKVCLNRTPSDDEWQSLFIISQKQAVSGFLFDALKGLNQKGQKVPIVFLYKWIGLNDQIIQYNIILNIQIIE